MNRLTATTETEIHFYDIDAVQIVWHGNYLKYMENGREAFGTQYGIAYMDIYNHGYITPIADLQVKYLDTVQLGDKLLVETSYIPERGAKLTFAYTIYRMPDRKVVVKATTTQLFMTREGIFEVSEPDFYREWKRKWGV